MLVLVGPCPFLCCFAVLLGGETQIWLGDLRVVFLAVVLFVWLVSHDDLPEIFGPHVSCTLLLFTAYAIVRTVPSANRPNRRKKKRKYLITGRISPWMTTLDVRPRLHKSCLTTTETSSTRYKQAMISASILSEQCGN